MNEFEKANVHELYSVLRFVDIKILEGENLNFIIEWTTGGTEVNVKYSANVVLYYLQGLEDR